MPSSTMPAEFQIREKNPAAYVAFAKLNLSTEVYLSDECNTNQSRTALAKDQVNRKKQPSISSMGESAIRLREDAGHVFDDCNDTDHDDTRPKSSQHPQQNATDTQSLENGDVQCSNSAARASNIGLPHDALDLSKRSLYDNIRTRVLSPQERIILNEVCWYSNALRVSEAGSAKQARLTALLKERKCELATLRKMQVKWLHTW